jgi:hypothetical protein
LLNLRSYCAHTVNEATNEQSEMHVCLTLKLEINIMSVGFSKISSGRTHPANRSFCDAANANFPSLCVNGTGKKNLSFESISGKKGTYSRLFMNEPRLNTAISSLPNRSPEFILVLAVGVVSLFMNLLFSFSFSSTGLFESNRSLSKSSAGSVFGFFRG